MKRANSHRTFNEIAGMLLLLVAAACSKEEIPAGDTQLPYGAYPMAFSIADNSLVVTSLQTGSDSYDTRSTADGDWSDEPSIVVKVNNELKKYQVEAGDDITQATLSVSPDEEAPFYWQNREDITVSAWWPYTETNGEPDDQLPPVVVKPDQSTHENFAASDYICAMDQTVQFNNPTLQFTHRTARIKINLISNAPTTGAIVRLTNLGTFDNNPGEIIAYKRSDNVYEALVAPQSIEAHTLQIFAEMPDQTVYSLIPNEAITLEAGEEYTYNISFTQDFTRIDDLKTFTVYTYEGLLAWARTHSTTQDVKCILGADITCPTVTAGESNWTPINTTRDIAYEPVTLIDIFDGNGYTIFGLTINSDKEEVGMFGTNYGIIQNLRLENVTINAPNANYVGGVAGVNAGLLEGCTVSGTINGQNYVGGITGDNIMCISDCNVSGSVSGNYYVGGIAGYNDMLKREVQDEDGLPIITYSYITGCYSTAYISGQENVGGVVGYNECKSTLAACYATGDVIGTSNNVGGVVGYNESESTLTACYATGNVSGTDNTVGGVVGYNNNGGDILTACYWGETPDSGIGGGISSTEIKQITDGNWDNPVAEMNNALTNLEVECIYIIKDGDTLPTLEKKE